MAEINDFSDDSIAEIAKTVRQLRWQVQNIREMATQLKRHAPTHEIRTGIMAAREGETYPASGCVLPVQFQDMHFEETVGQCDQLSRAPWDKKFVAARSFDGQYIREGTDVLIVKTPARRGRRWWIIPLESRTGRIGFRMTSVRSRLRNPDNTRYGQATAVVIWTAGKVPKKVGDTVTVTFPGILYAGAVKHCEGFADYFSEYSGSGGSQSCSGGYSEWFWSPSDHAWSPWASGNHCGANCTPSPPNGGSPPSDPSQEVTAQGGCIADGNQGGGQPASAQTIQQDIYLVADCEEMPAFIEFVTLEDRSYNVPNQKVKAIPRIAWGHNNCHLPLAKWYPADDNGTDCGKILWTWTPDANHGSGQGGSWGAEPDPDNPPNYCCDATGLQNPPPTPSDPTVPHTATASFGNPTGACNSEPSDFYVLFPQLEYPEALEGSDGTADFFDAPESDDPNDCIYIVRVANQRSPIVSSELTAPMCGQNPSTTDGSPKMFWPFSMPAPDGIYNYANRENHAGKYTDTFTADWDNESRDYRIKDVKKHEVEGMIGFEETDTNGCVKKTFKKQKMWVQLCTDAGQPITLDEYHLRDLLTPLDGGLRMEKGQTGDSGSGQEQCDPKLFLDVVQTRVKATCDTQTIPAPIEMALATKDVVIGSQEVNGCTYFVMQEIIYFGDCGVYFRDPDPLFCWELLVCPTGSG